MRERIENALHGNVQPQGHLNFHSLHLQLNFQLNYHTLIERGQKKNFNNKEIHSFYIFNLVFKVYNLRQEYHLSVL